MQTYQTPRADYRWEGHNIMEVCVDLSPDTEYEDILTQYNEDTTSVEIRDSETGDGYRVPLTGVEDLIVRERGESFNNGVLSMYLEVGYPER